SLRPPKEPTPKANGFGAAVVEGAAGDGGFAVVAGEVAPAAEARGAVAVTVTVAGLWEPPPAHPVRQTDSAATAAAAYPRVDMALDPSRRSVVPRA
ncbi:MAG TPA: hypothetical protein PKI09_16790, partial [Dermatophilaceae bacterium]|nr:hypothetical protein [Dermatophilaceae bacterium]